MSSPDEKGSKGLIRKTAFAFAVVLALALGIVVAGGAAAPAGQGQGVAGAASPPETVQPVTPRDFRGDVRRIHPVGPIRLEKPEPKEPDTPPPGRPVSDQSLQTGLPSSAAPAALNSFAGLDFANWGAGWPPDPNGDVGPTYYVQAVNTSIGIFDKSSGARVAALTFDSLFGSVPTGTPCDSSNQGDPVALYDPIADRWIVADFAWSNYKSGAMYECMAVSKSGDPVTGGWYFYAWQVETGGKLPDYPKLGLWPDGIYMSANLFSTTGSGSFQNVQVWAFNRQEMEAGLAAHAVTFNLPRTIGGVSLFSLLPSNARVATGLPPAGSPNYFASIWGVYDIRVWKFHVDWTNNANSTFTGPTDVPISAFNASPSSVPESGGNNVDTLSYRLMMQNQYTNRGGTESLWLTHTVGNGGSPNVAQVRWYQLNVTGGAIAASPSQQATWAPDSKNRFMPSLAVDKNGDMAIGYSVSDSSMSPAIRYAGRLVSDPVNTLGQGETSLIEGSGFQCCKFSDGTTNTRWGDYSAMTIDPDGCTFWYTNEYYANRPTTLSQDNWQTRIGSFRFGTCTTAAPPSISGFSPTSGPSGTSVTINGSNFTGATAVAFNGTSASFTVNSGTQITTTVPGGATSGPITVTTPGGTATSSPSNFSVTGSPTPTITSFSPTSGPVGTTVTITGTNLTGASAVKFNGTSATYTVNSATGITTTVPAGATTGPISVTTSGGTATSSGSFTVPTGAATLTATPSSVAPGGTVTVSWSNVAGPTRNDWIGLYHPGDANTAYIDWIYDDSCTKTAGSTSLSSGSCSFQMPSTAGTYEFRLLSNNGYSLLATSGQVTVN